MRQLPLIAAALALICFAATPAFAQGDGAWQQAERDRASQCQGRLGAGPDQSLSVGSTLPKYLRGNQYVVNDWRAHNLSAPSWRTHWVQVGADYVLVEVLTHRIRQVRLYGC